MEQRGNTDEILKKIMGISVAITIVIIIAKIPWSNIHIGMETELTAILVVSTILAIVTPWENEDWKFIKVSAVIVLAVAIMLMTILSL